MGEEIPILFALAKDLEVLSKVLPDSLILDVDCKDDGAKLVFLGRMTKGLQVSVTRNVYAYL